jgi:hypothetical protein
MICDIINIVSVAHGHGCRHPVGTSLANSARIGPDTGGGWTAALSNLQNALPVQQFAGPHHSGGFWNDGCLPLTPGKGCKGEGDSIYDGDNPSVRRPLRPLWRPL